MSRRTAAIIATAAILALAPPVHGRLAGSAAAAQPAAVGSTTIIVRSVHGTLQTVRRPLAVDDRVFWQELIETEAESAAKMLFLDGTTLSAGPDSRIRIDEFVLAGGGERRVVIGIARGILRFVTGTSPSGSYAIRTPSAMIGVRGTDFSVAVDEQGETRVNVLRGAISLTSLSGHVAEVRQGESGRTRADPAAPPDQATQPDAALLADDSTVTALLAIAGEGDPARVVPDGEVAALRARQQQAAQARAGLGASQTGPACTGC